MLGNFFELERGFCPTGFARRCGQSPLPNVSLSRKPTVIHSSARPKSPLLGNFLSDFPVLLVFEEGGKCVSPWFEDGQKRQS
jgi:hypothetical protein